MKDVSLKKMEERDKKKMDQLKKKLHTDDEGTNIIIICASSIFRLHGLVLGSYFKT